MMKLFLYLALCATALPAGAPLIKHVVILMLENRSFDHILGFLKKLNQAINGCVPEMGDVCTNPLDPSDPQSQKFPVTNNAVYVQPSDPNHGVTDTTKQVYGYGAEDWSKPAPMSGFVRNYKDKQVIMDCFDPGDVPAIASLAMEYAVFNEYYAAIPGPTMVNRMYSSSATSHGCGANDVLLIAEGYPQKTIFDTLDAVNQTWVNYFQDAPTALMYKNMRHPKNIDKVRSFLHFEKDALEGNLPTLTWIDPRYFEAAGIPADDMHPDHDVALGDALIKKVYDALRGGPKWNETLFIVTYDEHGGFFDHVPPPVNVPNPDGLDAHDVSPPFNFTRLGVRVPMILASPWIKKNTVIGTPKVNAYEHSSIPATLRNMFAPSMPFLTKRDAWAAPFDWIITQSELTEPRTDCLTELPLPRSHRGITPGLETSTAALGSRPLHSWHVELLTMASGLDKSATPNFDGMTEGQGFEYLRSKINAFLGREEI